MKLTIKNRITLSLGIILLAAVLGVLGGYSVRFWDNTPRVLVENTTCDLGRVGVGQACEAVFTFENTGSEVLEIDLLDRACTCTGVLFSSQSIGPDAKATVKVRANAPMGEGEFRLSISVRTNDPKMEVVKLVFGGQSVSVFNVQPAHILFGSLEPNMLPRTKKVTLERGTLIESLDMFQKTTVQCDNPYVELKLDKTREPYDLYMTLRDDFPLGALRGHIDVCLADLDHYKLELSFNGEVRGDYDVTPPSLFFGNIDPGIVVSKLCTISSPANIDRVAVNVDPNMKKALKWQVDYSGKTATLTVNIDTSLVSSFFDDSLRVTIESSERKAQTVLIPYMGIIKRTVPVPDK